MANALILVQLLLQLTGQTTQIVGLLNRAHSEGRDVTPEELDALFGADDQARAALQAVIDAKGG